MQNNPYYLQEMEENIPRKIENIFRGVSCTEKYVQ